MTHAEAVEMAQKHLDEAGIANEGGDFAAMRYHAQSAHCPAVEAYREANSPAELATANRLLDTVQAILYGV